MPYFLLALPADSAGALGPSTSKTTFSPGGTVVYSWDSATNTISIFGFNASIAAITNGGSVTESSVVSILPTPTKRRVYAYEGDYRFVKEPLLVAIDMGEITLL